MLYKAVESINVFTKNIEEVKEAEGTSFEVSALSRDKQTESKYLFVTKFEKQTTKRVKDENLEKFFKMAVSLLPIEFHCCDQLRDNHFCNCEFKIKSSSDDSVSSPVKGHFMALKQTSFVNERETNTHLINKGIFSPFGKSSSKTTNTIGINCLYISKRDIKN